MRQPPYHLRPNKAIDRFIFIEAIKKVEKIGKLSEYTYYGFGGPYLEDFRLLYESCPEIRMVSIERDANILKRQKFHRPCKTLRLEGTEFKSFLAEYDPRDRKSIFWLDNTDLKLGAFEDFQFLLQKVATNSIIKITLRANPGDYSAEPKANRFREEFRKLMQNPSANPPSNSEQFAAFVQEMLQVAAQQVLPFTVEMRFQPLTSFRYADGASMFTLTGIVCKTAEQATIRNLFKSWPFANLDWDMPKHINVPFLTTKERLFLQKHLPIKQNTGRRLLQVLGYMVSEEEDDSLVKLQQYADFHRHYPYFIRAMP
jgi:hypothetical protein